MRPKFNNKKQTLLWNVLTYGTAIVAGTSLGVFSEQLGTAGMAAVIVTTAVILAALYWWAYRTRRMEVANEIMEENRRKTRHENSADEVRRVNIYDIRVHNSPTKVIMEAVTILLLIITWGTLWAQHKWDWDSIGYPLILTIASVAALVAARFPFMMSDAEEQKDMSQVSLSVKKQQVYALAIAAMAMLSFLLNLQLGLLGMLLIFVMIESYFDRKKKAERNQDKAISGQVADNEFDRSGIQVTHDKEEMAFYIVTGIIILTAMCFLLLSLDVIKADFMRQSARLIFILLTAYTAFIQLAKAVKFSKADKSIENIRQFRLNVLEERVFGVEFAIISLILAIGIKHHIIDAATLFVAIIATLLGTYFIFNSLIKKAL